MTLFSGLNEIIPAAVAVDGVCGLTLDPATLMHTIGILMEAYDLTAREQEVARLVV
ncbi:hypothetical protein QEZ40_003983 [Streptomyces katrae]|uniref:Uncharacterized protein n=1 Tax=Streptomyces katrae TaxID=68223 RepID=A0ABT7GZE0_9ACTN|nr:hypothetical protein [Streptomyces katrae]MDK9498778.1 hypothetical protein [Streptomyces katrae]